MEIPIEGTPTRWMSISLHSLKELEEAGEHEEALSELRLRKSGLEKTLVESPLETAAKGAAGRLEEQVKEIVAEIEELLLLESIIKLKIELAQKGEELARDIGDQVAVLERVEEINREIEKLETKETDD